MTDKNKKLAELLGFIWQDKLHVHDEDNWPICDGTEWSPTTNLNQATDYIVQVLNRMGYWYTTMFDSGFYDFNVYNRNITGRTEEFYFEIENGIETSSFMASALVDVALEIAEKYREEWDKAVADG